MKINTEPFLADFQAKLTASFLKTPPASTEGVVREILGDAYLLSTLETAKEAETKQEVIDFHKELCISLVRDYESGEMRRTFNDALIEKVCADLKPSNYFE